MITETLMASGQWTIPLIPDTPWQMTDAFRPAVGGFGHVIVTPVWWPGGHLNAATLLEASIYTGVLRGVADRTTLGGTGLVSWLADDNGQGDSQWSWTLSPCPDLGAGAASLVARYTATVAAWPLGGVAVVGPNPVAAKTINLATGTAREKLDHLARLYGREWRILPNGAVQLGLPADLYPGDQTIVGPLVSDNDPVYAGVVAAVDLASGLEQYATTFTAGNGTATAAATGTYHYRDLQGNNARRNVDATYSQTAAADLAAIASTELAARNAPQYTLRVRSGAYAVTYRNPVGSPIQIHAPDADIEGTNLVTYRGDTLAVIPARLTSCTWPVRNGMGVYFRSPDAAGTLTDLTPWVRWETGDATLEVANLVPATITATVNAGHRTL